MCSEIIINGEIIRTQGELSKAIPISTFAYQKSIVINASTEIEYQEDNCLCGIDAWQTGKNNNLRVVQTAMYYHFGEDECNKAITEEIENNKRMGEKWENVKTWTDSKDEK